MFIIINCIFYLLIKFLKRSKISGNVKCEDSLCISWKFENSEDHWVDNGNDIYGSVS